MGVVFEISVWEPNPALYIFISSHASSLSFSSLAHSSRAPTRPPTLFDHGFSPSLRRFQRNFLFLYSSLQQWKDYGLCSESSSLLTMGLAKSKWLSLCLGSAAALFVGSFLGYWCLVTLLCLFYGSVGLILPSPLDRLKTMYGRLLLEHWECSDNGFCCPWATHSCW